MKNSAPKIDTKDAVIYMQEYCDRSGIHGLQYFLEKNRTKCERSCWFVIFLVSITVCFIVIFETYQIWNENAVGVAISTKKTLIYDIPFPAVTICPYSRLPYFNCFNYNLQHIPYENALKYAYFLCQHVEDWNDYFGGFQPNYISTSCGYDEFQNVGFNDSKEFFSFMHSVRPRPHINCQFQQEPCFFTGINLTITKKGVCYTFNILDKESIFRSGVSYFQESDILENYFPLSFGNTNSYNYTSNIFADTYNSFNDTSKAFNDTFNIFNDTYDFKRFNITYVPYNNTAGGYGLNTFLNLYLKQNLHKRQFFQGPKYGLRIEIRTVQSDIDQCPITQSGYEIFIHDSFSLPNYNSFTLSLDDHKVVKVKPIITNVSDSIKKYSLEKRRCYLEDEKHLKYFKIYTKANCEMECWTNYSLARCGCVHFSMPRNDSQKICVTDSENRCVIFTAAELASSDMIMEEIERGYSSVGTANFLEYRKTLGNDSYLKTFSCRCLPPCSDIEYDTEVSQGPLKYDGFPELPAILEVFFGENEVTSYVRKELYGPMDFLASFGGILGLFCGFSILSLVEILYFMTVRIICNRIIYGRWLGQKSIK